MIKAYLSTALVLASINGISQEAVPATGGEATGTGGTVSYTVGQIAYTTNSGTTGSAAQGVQQTFKIIDDSGIKDENLSLEVVTYPNPTLDKVNLEIKDFTNHKFSYQLTDMNGKLLEEAVVLSITTSLNLQNYESGTYILKVLENQKESKSFKIIKH